jgi:hypothetical protein
MKDHENIFAGGEISKRESVGSVHQEKTADYPVEIFLPVLL